MATPIMRLPRNKRNNCIVNVTNYPKREVLGPTTQSSMLKFKGELDAFNSLVHFALLPKGANRVWVFCGRMNGQPVLNETISKSRYKNITKNLHIDLRRAKYMRLTAKRFALASEI